MVEHRILYSQQTGAQRNGVDERLLSSDSFPLESIDAWLHRNPMAAAAGAFVIGLFIGLMSRK